jgi:uncharacterized delta-60 repeat protein
VPFAALALAIAAIAAPTASAKSGALDPGFGDEGRIAIALNPGSSWKSATIDMATARDGSIVVASDRQLVRYLPSGQLDRGFGDGGFVTLEQIDGRSFRLDDVAIDGSDRIVAFGTSLDLNRTFRIPSYSAGFEHPTSAVVLRLGSAGELDPTFGRAGIVSTDLGLPPVQAEDGPHPALIRDVAGIVDSQERPTLVAEQLEFVANESHGELAWVSHLVARLTPGGQLDPGFGAGSGITVLPGSGYRGLATAADNEPLLAWGGTPAQPKPLGWVASLRVDGSLEDTYGTAGVQAIRGGGGAVALDRFGRLLILERPARSSPHVLRLKPDGILDVSFGRNGRVSLRPPAPGTDLSAIAVDDRGRAVLVGTSSPAAEEASARFIVATRLRATGATDPRFGHNGWIRTGFGRRTQVAEDGPQVALGSGGRLVVADAARSPQLQPGGVVLARYLMR